MNITETFLPKNRAEWRNWLEKNHDKKTEIWLLIARDKKDENFSYLDAVEEALCFGWIDGILKVHSEKYRAQRFSPRRPKGNWTELNKERCRRLIKLGLMTEAGLKVMPDLNEPFVIHPQILSELKKDKEVWKNFEAFPELYKKIRMRHLADMLKDKRNGDFSKSLKAFIAKTKEGKMIGQWDDGGRLSKY